MQHPANLVIMFMMLGTACAVFYTKTTDNDYPRIGRRSFFTTANVNHYPRIGRRETVGSSSNNQGLEFNDLTLLDKRGVFTQGPHGSYPRVGRSHEILTGEDYMSDREQLLEKLSGSQVSGLEGSNGGKTRLYETRHPSIPLEIMFFLFDIDGDSKLSKEEFISGLRHYSQHTPAF